MRQESLANKIPEMVQDIRQGEHETAPHHDIPVRHERVSRRGEEKRPGGSRNDVKDGRGARIKTGAGKDIDDQAFDQAGADIVKMLPERKLSFCRWHPCHLSLRP